MGSIDRRVFAGQIPFTGVLGREGLFTVEQIAPDAPQSLLHKRVVVDAVISCNTCDLCRGGLSHLCEARTVPGAYRADGYAAPVVCAPIRSLIAVPRLIPDDIAVFAQSIAAAMHITNTALRDARGFITVLGDGLMALLVAQLAAAQYPNVRLLGKHPDRFTRCERWGIKHRHIVEAGKRNDQSVVIDCTGDASNSGFPTAVSLVRPRGKIFIKAPPFPIAAANETATGHAVAMAQAASQEVAVIGAGAGHIRDAISALSSRRVDVAGLVARSYPLGRAVEALQSLHDRSVIGCELSLA